MDIFLVDSNLRTNNSASDVWIVDHVFHALKNYGTPLVILLAIVSNVSIMAVVCKTRLKEHVTVIYACAELLSGTFSLTSVASAWLTSYVPEMRSSDWWCMVTSFNTHLTSFLSLWFVLFLSCDRTIVLFKPRCLECVNYLQNSLVAGVLAGFLTLAGIAIYMNEALLFSAVVISGRTMCLPGSEFSRDWSVISILDTAINFVTVHAIIIASNTYNAVQYRKRNSPSSSSSLRMRGGSFVFRSRSKPNKCSARRLSRSEYSLDMDLLKMSILITYGYLVLVLPGNCLRFIVWVGTLKPDQYPRAYVWQQLLFYLYILRTVLLPVSLLCVSIVRQAFLVCCRNNAAKLRSRHNVEARELPSTTLEPSRKLAQTTIL